MPILDDSGSEAERNAVYAGVEYETYMQPSAPSVDYMVESHQSAIEYGISDQGYMHVGQDELRVDIYDESSGEYVPATGSGVDISSIVNPNMPDDTRVRDYVVSHVIHCLCAYVMAMTIGYLIIMSLDKENWYYDMVALAIFVAVLGCVYMGCIIERSREYSARIHVPNS